MSIWDVELDTLRSARLLALRMHVARYVVRTGAAQRSVVALVDAQTAGERGAQLRELLEAAGAASQNVLTREVGVLPRTDVLLVGERGRIAADVAPAIESPTNPAADQVWALSLDRFTAPPGPEIVDAVEWLIRMIIPEALGANGTPPPTDVAMRVR